MNDKLPSIRDCTVNDCRDNDRWYCRAQKISVGKFDVPICNAYEKSELPEPASGDSTTRVTSCEIHRCLRQKTPGNDTLFKLFGILKFSLFMSFSFSPRSLT